MKATRLQVGPIGTNCYLFWDEATGKGAVVDPGDDAPAILKAVEESGMDLSAIFLTHGHHDHTGALRSLKAAFPQAPVYLHDGDYALAGDRSAFMPEAGERTASYGEGDVIPVGALAVTVYHTPGHTPGGVTLQVGELLFTGDTLFQGSMGRTDLTGGSYETIMASLKRLGQLPGDFQVCPGHEGMSTLEQERRGNYYLREAMGA
jgi:hydroxyacylglutathione hydrolase